MITDANEREKEWAFDQNEVDKITENNPYNKKNIKKVKKSCWKMYALWWVNNRSWYLLRLLKL